jgi:Raf kinase inhibitor-like YbhB/YbcL family protein
MLEHMPAWLGHALKGLRAGADALVIAGSGAQAGTEFATLDLTSPAFAHEGRLPPRFTADGDGVSPPLLWSAPPAGTAALALIVEDADAPTPQPLVHAIVWHIAADRLRLAEGAITADGAGTPDGDVGRNSYLREGWLPPDPPTGHGEHRYAFQLFALDAALGDPGVSPGRTALVEAMSGHVLAAGLLIGTYSREEAAPVGPASSAMPA